MKTIKKINIKVAAVIMTALFSCFAAFHVLVLSGVIPYDIVWGGRLENVTQMYVFEALSLAISFAIIVVAGIRGGYLSPFLPNRIVTFLLWALVVLFMLNTVGNLLAESKLEAILFTPFTFISAILCYRMAIE